MCTPLGHFTFPAKAKRPSVNPTRAAIIEISLNPPVMSVGLGQGVKVLATLARPSLDEGYCNLQGHFWGGFS